MAICFTFVCAIVFLVSTSAAAPPVATASTAPADINREFLDPTLDPEAWLGRFEIESREVFAARKSIVASLGLRPGDRIADIGSGTGLYLKPFSKGVGPTGRVYAVDISPRLVEFVEKRAKDENLDNVVVVLSTDTSIGLPPSTVNRAFACDAYHHFERYEPMLASIFAALVPGGEFVVVDFDRIPGVSREWLISHVRANKETVREEIVTAGFEFIEEVEVAEFKENYMLRFRKPGKATP